MNLEILTDINTEHNTSSLLKEHTQANIYSVDAKLQYLLEMYFQSTKLLKVLLSAISNLQLVTRDLIQGALELMPQLLDILKMDQELESDFHPELVKQYLEAVELQLV